MDFFGERLGLQLVGELPKLVGIDPRFEPEGVGNRLRRRLSAGGRLADAGAETSIDRFLERYAELPRALLQQPREIIIERQGRPHRGIILDDTDFDVKTSLAACWVRARCHTIMGEE